MAAGDSRFHSLSLILTAHSLFGTAKVTIAAPLSMRVKVWMVLMFRFSEPFGQTKLLQKKNTDQYGNYSVGHARAFKYDGKDYVIASSAGWASSYLTIQPADPNEDYLLRSVSFEAEESGPCSAYYYDVETGHGIVLYSAKSYFVTRYDIVKEIM